MHLNRIAALLPCLIASSAFAQKVDFNRDIRPILANHCLHCHGPDSTSRKGELRFDLPKSSFEDRGGYRVITPGKPKQSKLIERITSNDDDIRMPPPDAPQKKRLSKQEIGKIRRWIKQGAVWGKHWSFIKPKRPPLPTVKRSTWPRNGIDFFILKRLEQEKLDPSVQVDRTTLIRRVSFALTGLPPTPEAVDQFVSDKSPDAYERVVDRLLNKLTYGEHMAQAWLDAARYADSSGYQADWERFMWPWRDWVVKAFNRNMSFDRFTIEQIAGDLLPKPSMDQLIATGFNRNHRINDEGGSLDAEFEVEYVVDRVDTMSTIWLGLTTGCARCHDHKFESISQKEYYRLFAFFNNVPEKGIDGRRGAAKPFILVPNVPVQRELALLTSEVKQLRTAKKQTSGAKKSDFDRRINQLKKRIKSLDKLKTTQVMVMKELTKRRPTYLLKRGAYDHPDKTEQLFPELPQMFGKIPKKGKIASRMDIAKWLMDANNPLTARVTVNRIWQHHFGIGLVRTSEDFGTRGEQPSHPQLLDWLASELIRTGWDLKAMHRLIVTSATYRQSSRLTLSSLKKDPKNRLVARGPRRRLSGAAIRDQALYVSGLMSRSMGGKPVKPYQPPGLWKELSFATGKTTIDFYVQDHGESLYRRSLYTFWKRTVAPPRMSVFDGTGREMCRVRTDVTNTPMQALTLQNDVTFVEAARHLASRMIKQAKTPEQRIRRGWRLALSRHPTKDELAILLRAHKKYVSLYSRDKKAAERLIAHGESPRDKSLDLVQHAAYTVIAQTILNLDETITSE